MAALINHVAAALLSFLALVLPHTQIKERPAPAASSPAQEAAPLSSVSHGNAASSTAAATEAPHAAPTPATTTAKTDTGGSSAFDQAQERIADATRGATANVLCTSGDSRVRTAVSGSGVLIDPRGVVLTNAHVAQYFLLRDYPQKGAATCRILLGSPAGSAGTYNAEILYLPPRWISANASKIAVPDERGSGQYDFAFLLLTRSASGATVPAALPHIPVDVTPAAQGELVYLAAYPAQTASLDAIERGLYLGSSYGTVTRRAAFEAGTRTPDTLAIPGTFVTEQGSSGGPVAHANTGALAGIITGETDAADSLDRSLRAITTTHIDSSLRVFGQGGILELLAGDLAAKAAVFNAETAPGLTAQLVSALQHPSD